MSIERSKAGTWWAFCDTCGEAFNSGGHMRGYVLLSRQLEKRDWQQQPYLQLYCPQHRI